QRCRRASVQPLRLPSRLGKSGNGNGGHTAERKEFLERDVVDYISFHTDDLGHWHLHAFEVFDCDTFTRFIYVRHPLSAPTDGRAFSRRSHERNRLPLVDQNHHVHFSRHFSYLSPT